MTCTKFPINSKVSRIFWNVLKKYVICEKNGISEKGNQYYRVIINYKGYHIRLVDSF